MHPQALNLPVDFTLAMNTPSCNPAYHKLLTPHLPDTYSIPSTFAPPIAPYGVTQDPKTPRKRYLQIARSLLQLPLAHSSLLDTNLLHEAYTVRFTWKRSAARSVFLAGSFNGWQLPLALSKRADLLWERTVRLPLGKHRYRYIVDGKWAVDESKLCERTDDHGLCNTLIIDKK